MALIPSCGMNRSLKMHNNGQTLVRLPIHSAMTYNRHMALQGRTWQLEAKCRQRWRVTCGMMRTLSEVPIAEAIALRCCGNHRRNLVVASTRQLAVHSSAVMPTAQQTLAVRRVRSAIQILPRLLCVTHSGPGAKGLQTLPVLEVEVEVGGSGGFHASCWLSVPCVRRS